MLGSFATVMAVVVTVNNGATQMPLLLSVSDAANRLGARPQDITAAFYARHLDCDRCPVVAGRRLIPADYIEAMAIELRRLGKLPPLRKGVAVAR